VAEQVLGRISVRPPGLHYFPSKNAYGDENQYQGGGKRYFIAVEITLWMEPELNGMVSGRYDHGTQYIIGPKIGCRLPVDKSIPSLVIIDV
jgi:hypothetical protein